MQADRIALPPALRAWTLAAAALCLLTLLPQLPAGLALGCVATGALVAMAGWRRPLPAWLRLLLALAATALVLSMSRFVLGRDTACALLAAMLAIKPAELASLRDARSLVGFALFAPFSNFLLDQGPLSLLLGLLGIVSALVALLQLSAHASGDTTRAAPAPALSAVGRLLLTGLPLALAAFWLFPRLPTPLWGVPERALGQPGLSDEMGPGQWLDLMNDDRPALRVSVDGEVPDPTQMYWRGPVLVDYDGRTWTRSRWLPFQPPPQVERGGPVWDYEIELEPSDTRYLVALELAQGVPDGARMGWDYSLETAQPMRSVSRWRLRAQPAAAFEAALPEFVRQQTLRLPEGYKPRTLALARRWRAEHGPGNDAALVGRALAMIQAEFGYTLSTPLPGRHAADEFLFDWKQGFCEHFSSAFVVLMRAAGIPARVVTGYAGGYRNPVGGYWLVLHSDAHAWAEIWLPRRGWVRVDPTAAVAPERVYDTLADRQPGRIGGFTALVPVFNLGDWMRRGWNDFVLGFDANRQRDLLKPLGLDQLGVRELTLLFAAVAGLALAWMAWLLARGERERDPLLRAWHALDARYRRLGLGRAVLETAQDWARRVGADRPRAGEHLLSLSRRFSDARYAGASRDVVRRQDDDLASHRP